MQNNPTHRENADRQSGFLNAGDYMNDDEFDMLVDSEPPSQADMRENRTKIGKN